MKGIFTKAFRKSNDGESNNTRIAISIFLATIILLTVFCSFLFISVESTHHCNDDSCPICNCIEVCNSAITRIGSGLSFTVIVLHVVLELLSISKSRDNNYSYSLSPIEQKVRMNN